MKCRICGAKLAKKGDLCTKCYNELQEEMKFNEDKKVLFTLKPMYSLKRCSLSKGFSAHLHKEIFDLIASQ